MEDQMDVLQLWKQLHIIIACFCPMVSSSSDSNVSNPDNLNAFYDRFERKNIDVPCQAHTAPNNTLISVTKAYVRRFFSSRLEKHPALTVSTWSRS